MIVTHNIMHSLQLGLPYKVKEACYSFGVHLVRVYFYQN